MNKMLPISAVLLTVELLTSFSKEKSANAYEEKMKELKMRYHLELVDRKPSANAKKFATLGELETFLASRNKAVYAKTKSALKKVSKTDRTGTYGYSSNSVSGTGNFSAFLEFNQFLIDNYPEKVSLYWSMSGPVTSSLGTTNWYPPVPGPMSYWYTHYNGSAGSNILNVSGEYIEEYWIGTGVLERKYNFILDASWDSDFITASAVLEPKGSF